ncbi:MAG TPA: oligopeptide/dipeptide ABC transporter ATP-binding protein [Candidatus Methylomirabilis sp.]|nr:oligopeptide/dipeptide ABC transporter ATP-binding protein [Candidatus Methylomirabilis sp.]
MTAPPILEATGLVKHFPLRGRLFERRTAHVRAVDGVDFGVPPGTTFGLVGESGCGKTTVAMLLVKLFAPTAGRIAFEGQDLGDVRGRALREFRKRVQIVFQDPHGSLDPRQAMRSALVEPLLTLGVAADRSRALDRAVESVEMVGLDAEILGRLPHELSGGQRQRVVIARALSVAPRLVILDEPTSSVDVSVQAQILSLLAELRRRQGLTYFLISHNLVVVRYMSDVVAVMYLGKIVEMAESAALFTAALHPYSTALISAIPVPDPDAPAVGALAEGDVPSPVRLPSGCRYHPRCPYAEPVCREVDPPLVELRPGHRAACHFPGVASGGAPAAPNR